MKTFKFFFALCLCAGALSFASCGDDDPVTDGSGGGIPGGGNGGNGGSGVGTGTGNNSSLVKNAGVLLTSFDYDGTDYLSYDDLNRLTQITKSSSVIKFDYEKGKVTRTGNGEQWDFNVSFTPAGYISSISGKSWYENSNHNYSWTLNSTVAYAYDAAGHITAITENGTETGVDYGEAYTYSGTMTTMFTWSDNNLVKVVQSGRDNDGNSSTVTYVISYGSQENKYMQMPSIFVLCGILNSETAYTPMWALVGLSGAGTAKLPTSIEIDETYVEDGEVETDHYTYNLSYTLNQDGTIATESNTLSGYGYQYTNTARFGYTPVETTPNYPPAAAMSAEGNKSHKFFTSKMRQRMQTRRAARMAR